MVSYTKSQNHIYKAAQKQKRVANCCCCPIMPRVGGGGSFRSLEILTLPPLYMFRVMLFTFKEGEIIPTVGNYHRFSTRYGKDLRTPRHRHALSELAITFSGPLLYNKLPKIIKMCERESALKRMLKLILSFIVFMNNSLEVVCINL